MSARIIQTRFRDLPWEEVDRACVPDGEGVNREKWERLRGKPVRIKVPEIPEALHFKCSGPFYETADEYAAVCVHIAEIGD